MFVKIYRVFYVLVLLIVELMANGFLMAQTAVVQGTVKNNRKSLQGAVIKLSNGMGSVSNKNGFYQISQIPYGNYIIQASYTGLKTHIKNITLNPENSKLQLDFELTEDVFNLNQTVVSASRNDIAQQNSPVFVHTVNKRLFENIQAVSVGEGLNFSPGLRIENSCQNCGMSQLRMNGLQGPYSQIVINGRPVFSALAAVYGLDWLPASMIEKIEVVRGGGSVLYGGNAIAGTVNIITREPVNNMFEANVGQFLTGMKIPERVLNIAGTVVDDDMQSGVTFFGFNRKREPYDANDDGFSELTLVDNLSFGVDGFIKTEQYGKLKWGLHAINEFRRGGNKFDVPPHQADIAEQLQHNILGGFATYDRFFKTYKHKLSFYHAFQHINRKSYYGSNGRTLNAFDSLTNTDVLALNAYGNAIDFSMVNGIQYSGSINTKLNLTAGTEWMLNDINDNMPGYARNINQKVSVLGSFIQMEYKPFSRFTLLTGARFDNVNISGNANWMNDISLQKKFPVWVPRLSLMYRLSPTTLLRATYARGYRAPQAFSEDLHIDMVGGAARFIVFDPKLKTEHSNSFTGSFQYTFTKNSVQFFALAELFSTTLNNPFILGNQTALTNGVSLITKRNGNGAQVYGLNLEVNTAIENTWILQCGFTLQQALYKQPELIWQHQDSTFQIAATTTKQILRTPDSYGFANLTYQPVKRFYATYAAVYTGSMLVPHVIDPNSEQTIIKQTPVFFEHNIKLNVMILNKEHYQIWFYTGMQNISNSYQRDFDTGIFRDAGYIYGPLKPRTIFAGFKFGLN